MNKQIELINWNAQVFSHAKGWFQPIEDFDSDICVITECLSSEFEITKSKLLSKKLGYKQVFVSDYIKNISVLLATKDPNAKMFHASECMVGVTTHNIDILSLFCAKELKNDFFNIVLGICDHHELINKRSAIIGDFDHGPKLGKFVKKDKKNFLAKNDGYEELEPLESAGWQNLWKEKYYPKEITTDNLEKYYTGSWTCHLLKRWGPNKGFSLVDHFYYSPPLKDSLMTKPEIIHCVRGSFTDHSLLQYQVKQ